MTQRDKKIVTIMALVVLGAGAAFFFLKKSYLDPINDYNVKIADLDEKIGFKEQELELIELGKQKLAEARTRSLPVKQEKALLDYTGYLHQLLNTSGLTVVNVKPPDLKAPVDRTAGPTTAKKAAHVILPFTVEAKGKLAGVVAFMDGLQRTPVMHRVKSMNMSHQETTAKGAVSDTINLNMTLEAMIVAGTKPDYEPTLKPTTGLILPTPAHPRRYADIAKVNIFLGPTPYNFDGDVTGKSSDVTEELAKDYMKLVHTEPTSQEAFLHQLLFQGRDIKIKSKVGSGYDSFQVLAENRKVMVRAYVLRIDQQEVFFQVKDFVYGVHIGQTIGEAMRRVPLSDKELERLDLVDLVREYDAKSDAGTTKATAKKGAKTRQKTN